MANKYLNMYPQKCPHKVTIQSIITSYDCPEHIAIIGSNTCKKCQYNQYCSYNGDTVECNYPGALPEELFPAIL